MEEFAGSSEDESIPGGDIDGLARAVFHGGKRKAELEDDGPPFKARRTKGVVKIEDEDGEGLVDGMMREGDGGRLVF